MNLNSGAKKKVCIACAAALFFGALVGMGFWLLLPFLVLSPLPMLERQTPIREYLDRNGSVLQVERTYDFQYREPIPLSQVSPAFIDAIISVEDESFWRHGGVSYMAIARAILNNVTRARVRSGASTITMQLVTMSDAGRRKTLLTKLIQAGQARKMERIFTKERILEEYVNRLPFGGKIYGIQAASRFYFGKDASELNVAEAAVLAGLPQRPNGYRPDRHPEIAKRRQYNVLLRMRESGKLNEASLDELYGTPLFYRNFAEASYYRRHYHPEWEMYLRFAKREAGNGAYNIKTSLDMELQQAVLDTLRQECRQIPNAKDGAAIVIDVRRNEVLAMVGTLDFHEKEAGQVNAAVCRRSAGSTLKPFIYAEAIDGGLIAEDTALRDAPISYGAYSPGNYDGTFIGDIKVKYALSRSLNTPVLRLLEQLGTERILDSFTKLELVPNNAETRNKIIREKGLTIALGTIGHTLWQLTNAYATLARGGEFKKASFLQEGNNAVGEHIFSKPCACMVSRMLRIYQLPCTTRDVAWKTGTSNGLRDAWCFAYTPDYAVGVWIGNKASRASSFLVGGKVAAPCAGRIMSHLYANSKPQWETPESCLAKKQLCKKSGLSPSTQCQDTIEGWTMPDFALPECKICGKNKPEKLKIISPLATVYIAQNNETCIPLKADSSALWYVDGIYVGAIREGYTMNFTPGAHTVCAIPKDGSLQSSSVSFSVKP